MFVLLKSNVRFPELQVRPLSGWHAPEPDGWRWTARQFRLEAVLPQSAQAREFALRITVPEVVCGAAPVRMRAWIGETESGALTVDRADSIEFRGSFPADATPGAVLQVDFAVESAFRPATGDSRELGVIVPAGERRRGNPEGIPFRIS
jgi:hypothetical protein